MMFYKENGIPISGTIYTHLPYGPVPSNYELLFGLMSADNVINTGVVVKNSYERHVICPSQGLLYGVLTGKELYVLENVLEKFKNFCSVKVS